LIIDHQLVMTEAYLGAMCTKAEILWEDPVLA
jgi:hypothetical protein